MNPSMIDKATVMLEYLEKLRTLQYIVEAIIYYNPLKLFLLFFIFFYNYFYSFFILNLIKTILFI